MQTYNFIILMFFICVEGLIFQAQSLLPGDHGDVVAYLMPQALCLAGLSLQVKTDSLLLGTHLCAPFSIELPLL